MSNNIVVACAQSTSVQCDIVENVKRHLKFMKLAALRNVQFIVFPELSLTGYEIEGALKTAIYFDDERLSPLREESRRSGITAVVGAPVRFEDKVDLYIGAIVIAPKGALSVCTKQYLHEGEEVAFSAGGGGSSMLVSGNTVALAICADTVHLEHAWFAAEHGANIYAAGVLITEHGYLPNASLLQQYATQHNMAVMMANHGGESGGWVSAGKSAVWAEGGRQVIAAEGIGDLLVVAAREGDRWSGEVAPVDLSR